MAGAAQAGPVLCTDGQGGAIIAWSDFRAGFAQAYAQNVDRFGQLGDARPGLTSIKDVKADQGGQVRMAWNASYLDANPLYGVSSYWIWRQTPGGVAAAAVQRGGVWADGPGGDAALAATASASGPSVRLFRHADATAGFAWEFVASQPANGSPQYSYVAPTASDSVPGYNPYTAFMVEARGTAAGAFWDSPADSGYSVDNLPPQPPAPFTAAYSAGTPLLHWGPNLETDLASYRLYRGGSLNFVPGPSNLIASPADTGFADVGASGSYYQLSAVDIHGNESRFALVGPVGTTDAPPGPLPRELALSLTSSNPARGSAALRLALPRETRLNLGVFDVNGRRVRELASGVEPAGEHALRWDGTDAGGAAVPSGLYFLRLETPGRSLSLHVVMTR